MIYIIRGAVFLMSWKSPLALGCLPCNFPEIGVILHTACWEEVNLDRTARMLMEVSPLRVTPQSTPIPVTAQPGRWLRKEVLFEYPLEVTITYTYEHKQVEATILSEIPKISKITFGHLEIITQ